MVHDFGRKNPHAGLRSTSNREAEHIQALRDRERREMDERLKRAGIDSAKSVTETPVSSVRQSERPPAPNITDESEPLWEPPEGIAAEETPASERKRVVAQARKIKDRVEEFYVDARKLNSREANEFYLEDLQMMNAIVEGLVRDPKDDDLIARMETIAAKYQPPSRYFETG